MNESVAAALAFCSSHRLTRITLVVPFAIADAAVAALRRDPRVRALHFVAPAEDESGLSAHFRVGAPHLCLRRAPGTLVVVVGAVALSDALLLGALLRGKHSLVCWVDDGFRRVAIPRFWLWAAGDRLIDVLERVPPCHPLARLVASLRRRPGPRSLGVPVVAADTGGMRDSVEPGVTGWLSRDDGPRALAGLVLALLDDPRQRVTAQGRDRAFIAERFGMERMLRETLADYAAAGEHA